MAQLKVHHSKLSSEDQRVHFKQRSKLINSAKLKLAELNCKYSKPLKQAEEEHTSSGEDISNNAVSRKDQTPPLNKQRAVLRQSSLYTETKEYLTKERSESIENFSKPDGCHENKVLSVSQMLNGSTPDEIASIISDVTDPLVSSLQNINDDVDTFHTSELLGNIRSASSLPESVISLNNNYSAGSSKNKDIVLGGSPENVAAINSSSNSRTSVNTFPCENASALSNSNINSEQNLVSLNQIATPFVFSKIKMAEDLLQTAEASNSRNVLTSVHTEKLSDTKENLNTIIPHVIINSTITEKPPPIGPNLQDNSTQVSLSELNKKTRNKKRPGRIASQKYVSSSKQKSKSGMHQTLNAIRLPNFLQPCQLSTPSGCCISTRLGKVQCPTEAAISDLVLQHLFLTQQLLEREYRLYLSQCKTVQLLEKSYQSEILQNVG